MQKFENPYRPGAGHMPTFLAGRGGEREEFKKLLGQTAILKNLTITGLRGVGKTVLLETLKPDAFEARWLWVGTDLSEAASLSEDRLAIRLMTDLAVVSAGIKVSTGRSPTIGFSAQTKNNVSNLGYDTLSQIYTTTPGLAIDKLKAVLEAVWGILKSKSKGIIFSYDEAQNLADHASKEQFPLSLLLDLFQSLQKKGLPLMLVLAGLPTLFPKLVVARTYSERMFQVLTLEGLDPKATRDAILKPIEAVKCPVKFAPGAVESIVEASGGYPYFIQFIGREAYDAYLQNNKSVPLIEIIRKLDSDFFMGRWSKATDRQRQLLLVVAKLDHANVEFTVQDVAELSQKFLPKGFSASHVSQMFNALGDSGLIYRNRHGRYSFAVPLLGEFILRQHEAKRIGF